VPKFTSPEEADDRSPGTGRRYETAWQEKASASAFPNDMGAGGFACA
jgi:hypothetical protein